MENQRKTEPDLESFLGSDGLFHAKSFAQLAAYTNQHGNEVQVGQAELVNAAGEKMSAVAVNVGPRVKQHVHASPDSAPGVDADGSQQEKLSQ